MSPTNLIINGTFDAGSEGWSGTDLETKYNESAYLKNGSSNRVAEMDGQRGKITEMEQTFTVDNPASTELTLDTALRNASMKNAGDEGFTVEIVDSDGAVIASTTVMPTTNEFVEVSFPVTFPSAGDYTLRLKELGPKDSLGAIIDNVQLLICFDSRTRVRCPGGSRQIGDIRVGEEVTTAYGPRRVRWVGRRRVSRYAMARDPRLAPIRIRAGALGRGMPRRDVLLSRQHRVRLTSRIAERMFGESEVLVAAFALLGLPGVTTASCEAHVDYVHLLFDAHEIIFAEDMPCESLLTGPEALKAVSPEARAEILALVPGLDGEGWTSPPAALIPSPRRQRALVARHIKNGRALVEPL